MKVNHSTVEFLLHRHKSSRDSPVWKISERRYEDSPWVLYVTEYKDRWGLADETLSNGRGESMTWKCIQKSERKKEKNNRKTRRDFEDYDRLFHADLKDADGLGFERDTFFSSKNENSKNKLHSLCNYFWHDIENKQWINYTHLQLVPSVIHVHCSKKRH